VARIKHNDLSWYFMRPREELPAAYVRKCEKFFKSLKRQASSSKRQASSLTNHESWIIKDLESEK
tara:strand:- start:543 stop:737 length:195 start_codon:yes stop_codon:yes gene_type:complete